MEYILNLYHSLDKLGRQQIDDIFLIPRKQDLTLHEMVSNPFFLGKQEISFNISFAENFAHHAKH